MLEDISGFTYRKFSIIARYALPQKFQIAARDECLREIT